MAKNNYDEGYFSSKKIVIVTLIEGSGSVRHRVDKIDQAGNIYISRLLPEIGTADMAEWRVLIELSRDVSIEDFEIHLESVRPDEFLER